MHKLSSGLALAATILLAPAAFAQCSSLPGPNGTAATLTSGSIDDGYYDIVLSFPFTFPGGSAYTQVRIDTNGRVTPTVAGDPVDLSESLGEFFTSSAFPSLAMYWNDLDGNDGGVPGSMNILDNGSTQVLIEYFNWSHWLQNITPFTYQIELNSDGSFAFIYSQGNTDLDDSALVGGSPGNGHVDPGESDLSASAGVDSGSEPAVYQYFGTGDDFDLSGFRIDFIPNGSGGYVTLITDCGLARAEEVGPSCVFGPALAFDPSGTGGYVVTQSSAMYDAVNLGSTIAVTDDSITTVFLGGATFIMPNGSAVTELDIDSNGRILEVGTDTSDFSPSVAEIPDENCLYPFHTDLSPQSGTGLFFYTDGATVANITWLDTPQFGAAAGANTFQVQLDLTDGSWDYIYVDVAGFTGDDVAIGCGNGDTIDPGASDLSAPPILSATSTVYEYWTPGTLDVPLASNYAPLTLPVVGTTFMTEVSGISPTATGVVILLGITPLGAPLNIVFTDMPSSCVLDHAVDLGDTSFLPGFTAGDATAAYDIAIPAGPSAVGFPVRLQGVVVDFSVPWAAQVGVTTTNGIATVFGI